MGTANSSTFAVVQEELNKYKGIALPVRALLPERILVKYASPKRLHPNPEDEFCDPNIGPNDEIISRYSNIIAKSRYKSNKCPIEEPLIVEKMKPNGYMIMNGHHRWAAALRMSVSRVPITIVNLTKLEDVKRMLSSARNSQRVTLDLDEVVFHTDSRGPAEKSPPFPMNLMYRQRLRLGIPALFSFLHKRKYDVWVYSSKCYSFEYVRHCLLAHRAWVDGIITGTGRATRSEAERKELESLLATRYEKTIHLDRNSMVLIHGGSKEFSEIALSGSSESWSGEVMDRIREMSKA